MKDYSITHTAILVALSITGWQDTKHDRTISEEVAVRAQASSNAGRYMKHLLPKHATLELKQIESQARQSSYNLTMPWDRGRFRLLPVKLYDTYCRRLNQLADQYFDARKLFISTYDNHVAYAQAELGALFNPNDYPSPDNLVDRLTIAYRFAPVPDANHFVAQLIESDIEQIKLDIANDIQEKINSAVQDVYQRIGDGVRLVSERLTPDANGNPKTFRNTMIEHLVDLTAIVPALNITNDPVLATLCTQVKDAIDNVSPDQLRPINPAFDEAKYQDVQSKMATLSEKYAGYFGAPD